MTITTKKDAKKLLYDIIAQRWLAKEQRQLGLPLEEVGQCLINTLRSRKNVWWSAVLLCITSLAFIAFGFAWMNYFYDYHLIQTVGNTSVLMLMLICCAFGFAIGWFIYSINKKPKESSAAAKYLVIEYLDLCKRIVKVDLWGPYVDYLFELGLDSERIKRRIQSDSATEVEYVVSAMLEKHALTALHSIGKKVNKIKQTKSAPATLTFKTKTFIPAFKLAKELGLLTPSVGYEQFIPDDDEKKPSD